MSEENVSYRQPILTKEVRRACTPYVTQVIRRLWRDSVLSDARAMPAVQRGRAYLQEQRAVSDAHYERAYLELIVAFTGIGGLTTLDDGRTTLRVNPPRLDRQARLGFDRLIVTILDSAGLFNPDAPHAHLDHWILAAHLLLAPDEVKDARKLGEPFPWPWLLLHLDGMAPTVKTEPGATDRQRVVAHRIQAAINEPYRKTERLRRGSTPEATRRRARKREARLRVGEVANELWERHLTPEGILLRPEFQAVQAREHTRIETEAGVLKIIREFRTEKGLDPLPRGRPPRR